MARRRPAKGLDENAQLAGAAVTEIFGMVFGNSPLSRKTAKFVGNRMAEMVNGKVPPQPQRKLPKAPKGMKYIAKPDKPLRVIPVAPGVDYIPPPKKRTT